MTVAENVAFGLEMQGVAAAERTQARRRDAGAGRPRRLRRPLPAPACRAASSSAWRSPARSSSGRRSCCSTSRCRNLDAKLREEMQIELRQIQRTVGTTTILVTHDQAEAMALSRPHRGDEPRPRRADRPAARGLRAAGDAVRRELPRQDQLCVNGATVRPEQHLVRDLRPRRHGARRASSRATTGSIRSTRRRPRHRIRQNTGGPCRPRARRCICDGSRARRRQRASRRRGRGAVIARRRA